MKHKLTKGEELLKQGLALQSTHNALVTGYTAEEVSNVLKSVFKSIHEKQKEEE